MDDARVWFALTIREAEELATDDIPDRVSALLDDYSPVAIEDLNPLPLPPGGVWDPTLPPPPDPPPAPLAWRVFFVNAADREGAAVALRAAFPAWALSVADIDDEDWAARSQRALGSVHAGDIVVAPPWDIPTSLPCGHTLVVIEPSRGFGTGHHASTRLCLRALSSVDVTGLRVLDLGTGSGVLAMAAASRGASRVLGVDVDPDALSAARDSQTLNPGAAQVEWLAADYRATPVPCPGPWDVVFANLTGGMLRSSAVRIRELMGPTGLLIASGFDETEGAAMLTALGILSEQTLAEDGWLALVGRRV